MQKLFSFVSTDCEIVSEADRELSKVLTKIRSHSVVVKTALAVGAGVVLRERIITSLLLVRNFEMVTVIFSGGSRLAAVVDALDERNYLARLRLITDHAMTSLPERIRRNDLSFAEVKDIGSPLLTPDTSTGRPVVKVAGMGYVTRVAERFEDSWRIDAGGISGRLGSGVFNDEGAFVGLSLGAKTPPPQLALFDGLAEEYDRAPRVYALPACQVFDFVETK
jgi:S1-C subfamily serine protease